MPCQWKVAKIAMILKHGKKRQQIQSRNNNIILARTPEIGQGLGRILSCGARKQEQT